MTFRERAFGAAARLAVRRPKSVLASAVLLAVAATTYAATHLGLKTSNLDLVDPDLPEVARFRAFAEVFGTPNVLVVVLEGGDEPARREAAVRVADAARGRPGVRAAMGRLPYDGAVLALLRVDPWFASEQRDRYYVFVQPDDPHAAATTIEPFVRGVKAAVEGAGVDRLGVRAGYTGLPQYALDDRDVIQRDLAGLSALSFVLVGAIFAFAFGEFLRPIWAMALLALAAAVVLALAAVVPGHLTLLSAFFFSALFGLGSDYGIYVIDAVEERLADGALLPEAIQGAVVFLAPGLATEALATAAAFLVLVFSGFRGFAELGVIGAAGIAIALASMVFWLPAALTFVKGRRRERKVGERRLGRLLLAVQHPAVAVAIALFALGGLSRGLPPFDGDYLNLQPRDSEAARLEREMVAHSRFSPQFAAFAVPDAAAAKALTEKLRLEETVAEVRSASDLTLLDAAALPIAAERAAFRAGFVAPDGRLAVYAYPNGDVWDPEFQERFLDAMRALDPQATGMPFLGHFMIDLSRRALRITGALAGLVVLILVTLEFGLTRWTALAVAPTFLGVAAMLGVMRATGLAFNPIDVMALPVVIGTAVDSGVHVTHRFLAERGDFARTLAGSGRTVLVSAATTLAGFGTLAFTSHRGLASFALAMTIGVVAALAVSVLSLPTFLRWAAPAEWSAE
ncbi:MAG TPA: MMPL family transporter [Candidatus Polarisedimenticolaceae bacterium]